MELDYTLGELLSKTAKALERVDRALEGCYQDVLRKAADYHSTINKLHYSTVENTDKATTLRAFGKVAKQVLEDAGHSTDVTVPQFCVIPENKATELIKKASYQYAEHESYKESLQYALDKAAALHNLYDRLSTWYKSLREDTKWEQPLRKVAADEYYQVDKDNPSGKLLTTQVVKNLYGTIPAVAYGAGSSMLDAGSDIADKAKKYLDWKAQITSKNKGEVLDAELLKNDRELDRMLAWSDMMSDPRLKGYPAEDVHMAVNKLMDADRNMESPSNRELLRQNLRRAMVQSGELSTADTAAMMNTLKAKADASKKERVDQTIGKGEVRAKGYGQALAPGGLSLQSLKTPLKGILDIPGAATGFIWDTGEAIYRTQDAKQKKEQDAQEKAEQKADQEAEKARRIALDDAREKREKYKALNDAMASRAKVKQLNAQTSKDESQANINVGIEDANKKRTAATEAERQRREQELAMYDQLAKPLLSEMQTAANLGDINYLNQLSIQFANLRKAYGVPVTYGRP